MSRKRSHLTILSFDSDSIFRSRYVTLESLFPETRDETERNVRRQIDVSMLDIRSVRERARRNSRAALLRYARLPRLLSVPRVPTYFAYFASTARASAFHFRLIFRSVRRGTSDRELLSKDATFRRA